ncbi:hypothetical protein ABPG75_004689 [Micractinium tetrahymenae]
MGHLAVRPDDAEANVEQQLAAYEAMALPVIRFYQERDKLQQVEITAGVQQTMPRLLDLLRSHLEVRSAPAGSHAGKGGAQPSRRSRYGSAGAQPSRRRRRLAGRAGPAGTGWAEWAEHRGAAGDGRLECPLIHAVNRAAERCEAAADACIAAHQSSSMGQPPSAVRHHALTPSPPAAPRRQTQSPSASRPCGWTLRQTARYVPSHFKPDRSSAR